MITCLWCGTQFPEHEGVPILGQKPEDKLVQRIAKIGDHLKGRHLDKLREIMTLQATLGAMAIMCNCSSDEPFFNRKRQEAGAAILQLVKRPLADEDIERRVRTVFAKYATPLDEADVSKLIRDLRDYLEYRDILQPPAATSQEPR